MRIQILSARKTIAGLSLAAFGFVGGAALTTMGTASAATTVSPATASTTSTTGVAETPLTGAALSNVKAAVLAKYPGATFGTVTTEDTGGYEAHITTTTGSSMTVLVNTAYAVTGTEAGHGHGHGGGTGTETALSGANLSNVKAAVLAKYPGATFQRVSTEDGGGFEAHITSAAGQAVTVVLDASFAITGTE